MTTTADCKKFLVRIFMTYPRLITELFDSDEGKQVLAMALTEKLWKRTGKCKPNSEKSQIFRGSEWLSGFIPVYVPDRSKLHNYEVIWERSFSLNDVELGGQVAFLVFETDDGLYLGDYVGA